MEKTLRKARVKVGVHVTAINCVFLIPRDFREFLSNVEAKKRSFYLVNTLRFNTPNPIAEHTPAIQFTPNTKQIVPSWILVSYV